MPDASRHDDAIRQPMWCVVWSTIRRRIVNPGSHWVWLSMLMYATACFLPAIPPIWGDEPVYEWACLTPMVYVIPAWWANPTYFLAVILYACRRRRAATEFDLIATILGVSLELMELRLENLIEQEIGCYVWIAGIQVLTCNLLWEQWMDWKRRQQMF